MQQDKLTIAVIYGSNREGRFCDIIAEWAINQIERSGDYHIQVIDPIRLGLPERHPAQPDDAVLALRARVDAADAFVVITPEYNHGYTAALKQILDSANVQWHAKPAGFVSYGGISGGLRAVEQLRQVFAEMHAVTVRDSVCFPNYWDKFDAQWQLKDPAQSEKAMSNMLNQLVWWADMLRVARHAEPYKAA